MKDNNILDDNIEELDEGIEVVEEVEIEQNQLRARAKKLVAIEDDEWDKVAEDNKYIMNEYFDSMSNLSPATVTQYKSAIRIFLVWNMEYNYNKKFYKITKRDFMKYITFLTIHGLSSSGIKLKKSAVSSLCNFVDLIIREEIKEYSEFRSFADNLPSSISANQVYEKKLITKAEYAKMMRVLAEKGDIMGQAWLSVAFHTGARRGEIRQFTNDIVNAPYEVDKDGNELNYKLTDYIRGKGKGRDGKLVKFMVSRDVMPYIEELVKFNKKRGKSKYLFVATYSKKTSQISLSWSNDFCRRILTPIVGRRINPHLFKASAITHLLIEGHDMKTVSKYVAQHSDISTTAIYDLRDDSEERDSLF